MTRNQFEHAIRAAGAVLGVTELIVLGSQAVHASMEADIPLEAMRSVEVDIAVYGDLEGRQADLIDGSIGEASMFHETFGYYAQGVVERTAVLPEGWRDRLVRFATPRTGGVVAWCLDVHDLWISKAIAGREKDRDFCRALIKRGAVTPLVLRERLEHVHSLGLEHRSMVSALIQGIPHTRPLS